MNKETGMNKEKKGRSYYGRIVARMDCPYRFVFG